VSDEPEEAAVHRAVFPGSFDPVTNGHLDVVSRAAAAFDEVVVAVLNNESKPGFCTVAERLEMLAGVVSERGLTNVRPESFQGLLVDFCRAQGATVIVKGLRAPMDADYELPMAHMNAALSGVDTVLFPTSPQWSFVSSSLVREVARLGGDVSPFVPSQVASMLAERLRA
jgi:pantetheine-phosphate adenylyltransferase